MIENYEKGLSWYRTFFEKGFKYNGESSVNYSKRHIFPSVPSENKGNVIGECKTHLYC